MDNYVFISYSSRDRQIAEELCTALESRDIKCWIAPRDILPGAEWVEATVDALDNSSVTVLILSSSSNSSAQVKREVERAASREIPIIPFRIDDSTPSRSMEFFISAHHWLNAQEPPMERHFQKLADTAQQLLAQKAAARVKEEAEKAAEEQVEKEAEAAQERARQEAEEAQKAQEADAKAKEEAEKAAGEQAEKEARAARERARQEVEEAQKAQEAAIRARKEAEEAAEEQAEKEVRAARERAREAEEARKTQKAAIRARKEAEEVAKKQAEKEAGEARKRARQEARKSAETAVAKKPIPVELPAQVETGIARAICLWAGIILSLAGLGLAWYFTLTWRGAFGSPIAKDPWYLLFALILLLGLPCVIPGVFFISRGITGYLISKPADGRVSNWWWLLPVVLGFIGGVISWVIHKNVNWHQARNMLTVGILMTFIFTIPVLAG